jgi:GGDEF domain-containing protein
VLLGPVSHGQGMPSLADKSCVENDVDSIVSEALRDAGMLKGMLDHLETGVYIVDRSRRILYWNWGAERITGYLSQDVAGHFCHGDLLMHCDAVGAPLCGLDCPLSVVMKDGKPRECRIFLRHRNGHRIPVHVRSHPIADSTGAIIGAMEVFAEIRAGVKTDAALLLEYGCLEAVTGLPKREYGEMKVGQALQALKTFGLPFGWLRVELDELEVLEHKFGHGMIDAAAAMIARTMHGNLGSFDLLTCWDRADFRIEVHGYLQRELADLAEELVMLVGVSNLEWWGDPRRVTVSIAGVMAERGETCESIETRVGKVIMNCRAGGGNRAAVAHFTHAEPDVEDSSRTGGPCLR